MAVQARARGVGMSVDRVRYLLEAVRGMPVQRAMDTLRYLPGPAAAVVNSVLRSAVANAQHNLMLDTNRLRVSRAHADDGPRLRRFRAKARGRVSRIARRSSHITIEVDEEI